MANETPIDIFISYSRSDNSHGHISLFATLIKEDYRAMATGKELRVFFDSEEIKVMDDWEHRILRGLREARMLLACISPQYFASPYCRSEWEEYRKQEVAWALHDEGVAPIYFIDVPGWDDGDVEEHISEWVGDLRRRQYLDLRAWFEEGTEALNKPVLKLKLQDLNAQICRRLERMRSIERAKGNVDRHNEHFVGRTRELRRMRELVGLGKVGVLTAIHGLGGIGKTALATEYAYCFASEYPGGRWKVRCEGLDDLRIALIGLAGARDLEFEFNEVEKHSLDLALERVLRALKERAAASDAPGRVLLLLDNVDQPRLLEPAQLQRLPHGDWLHLIATTRLGENELFASQKDRAFLAVDELPEGDAVALIESYQPLGKFPDEPAVDAAHEIVRLLGRFTLAVETAAVFLGQFTDVSCSAFRDRLSKEGLTGLEEAASETEEGVRHGEKRLTATLRPTLERLSEVERFTLNVSALLPAEHVALPWVRVLVAGRFPELAKDAAPGHPDPWRKILRRLHSLRLFQATVESNEIRMHRLLQEVLKLAAGQGAVEELEGPLLAHVAARAHILWDKWVDRENRWEIPPIEAYAWQLMARGTQVGAFLASQVAGPLQRLGKFEEAEQLLRRALAIDEANLGPEHTEVAVRLNNLAELLMALNRTLEAEPLLSRALAIDERSLGPNHPNVATRLHNTGRLLHETNRSRQAEPLLRRALDIDEKALGPTHPDVSRDLATLGRLLADTNRIREAAPLFERALAISEQNFGPNHPEIATDLGNLAALFQDTNRMSEAELLFRRALAIDEQTFGTDHLNVARDLSNLAGLFRATKRIQEAGPLFSRALAIAEKSLGEGHPHFARYLNNLANYLRDDKRLAEAESHLRRALALDEKNFGSNHPRVATRLNNLASVLHDTNRLGQAESMLRRALAIDKKSLGSYHPTTAVRLINLAQVRRTRGRQRQAEPLMREALEILVRFTLSSDHEHPNLQPAVGEYSALLEEMGLRPAQIRAQLKAIAEPFGIDLSLGGLQEGRMHFPGDAGSENLIR